MHVRAVAYEEELPSHLHACVVEFLRNRDDRIEENDAKAADPDNERRGTDDDQGVPLSLEARNAPVAEQGRRAVRVRHALQNLEAHLGERDEEGQDQGEVAVQGPVEVHRNAWEFPSQRPGDAKGDCIQRGEQDGSETPQGEGGREGPDADASGTEHAHQVIGERERAQKIGHVGREHHVHPAQDADNLVMIQQDEEHGRYAVLP
mmetsp:Transcript_67838/g.180536  ORF Transcript_67838/g.180536 Transcript_67838/m.180536 type:complete len:205 (-) Transcript_67838:165-779(-)